MKIGIVMASLVALAGAGAACADALPVGDAAAGQRVFNQCSGCHAVGKGAEAEIGPVLNGVVGRKAGSAPGFAYSAALKASGLSWDAATLTRFVQSPQKTVPGTEMGFAGLAKPQDAADVIAYLKQYAADGTKQ